MTATLQPILKLTVAIVYEKCQSVRTETLSSKPPLQYKAGVLVVCESGELLCLLFLELI